MKRFWKIKNKTLLISAVLLILAMVLSACGNDTTEPTSPGTETDQMTEEPADETVVFTLEELAQYDGQDGRAAYIAVDGIVYDVSDIPQWADGMHAGRFAAGKDYSEEIRSESPHGTSMLSRATEVGVLAD